MSMPVVREAAIRGLGTKGSLQAATMDYVDGGAHQKLTIVILKNDGTTATLAETVPASTDLIAKACAMAAAWADQN